MTVDEVLDMLVSSDDSSAHAIWDLLDTAVWGEEDEAVVLATVKGELANVRDWAVRALLELGVTT